MTVESWYQEFSRFPHVILIIASNQRHVLVGLQYVTYRHGWYVRNEWASGSIGRPDGCLCSIC